MVVKAIREGLQNRGLRGLRGLVPGLAAANPDKAGQMSGSVRSVRGRAHGRVVAGRWLLVNSLWFTTPAVVKLGSANGRLSLEQRGGLHDGNLRACPWRLAHRR